MSDEETEFIDSFSRYEKKSKLKDNTAVVIAEKKQVNPEEVIEFPVSLIHIEQVDPILHIKESLEAKAKNDQELTNLRDLLDKREIQIVSVLKEKMEQTQQIFDLSEKLNQNNQTDNNLQVQIKNLEVASKSMSEELKNVSLESASCKAQLQMKTSTLAKQVQIVEEKDRKIVELNLRYTQLQKQNQDLTNELVEFKNNELTSSVCGGDPKQEFKKLIQTCEKLKQDNLVVGQERDSLKQKLTFARTQQTQTDEKTVSYLKQIALLEDQIQQMNYEKMKLQGQINKQPVQINSDEVLKARSHKQDQQLRDQKILIDELIALNNKLNEQDQNNKQPKDDHRIKLLEKEVNGLEQMLYESPIAILFNLLEDRLSKQNTKQPNDKKDQNQYWQGILGEWIAGLKELEANFKNINIQFVHQLSRKQ